MTREMSNQEAAAIEDVIVEDGKLYLSPCQVRCPLGIDIQRNHAMVALLDTTDGAAHETLMAIGREVYEKSPLFPLLCSYICGLCENDCNYQDKTGAVRRRMIMKPVAREYVKFLDSLPALPRPTKDKVAVIGGGPSGLMCAYELGKRGYQVTIIDRNPQLGGAMRLIPAYRLPQNVIDIVIRNLLRIAHIEMRLGVEADGSRQSLERLQRDGYQAVYLATGTPAPRPLTFGRERVGSDMAGVMYGLNLLYEVLQGNVPQHLYKGKRVIVVGGGNVAFDVARTARRLGGEVTLVCLECADKSCLDGIPADTEEVEGASEEGIKIIYSHGVSEIIGKDGHFHKIRSPRCTAVFNDEGRFSPRFDENDSLDIAGDVLLITIGQGPEHGLLNNEALVNEHGRLDIDPVTLMSHRREGIFIGGDVRRVGFASEAMRDGAIAAESIDRYLRHQDLAAGRTEADYEPASIPERVRYKFQPELKWKPARERFNFEPFEKEYTLAETIAEARRCLYCGPCKSCKGCVMLGLQPEIADIQLDEDTCSGCGVCIGICPYGASLLITENGRLRSAIDENKCKRCGVCVTVCPSGARCIEDNLTRSIGDAYASLAK